MKIIQPLHNTPVLNEAAIPHKNRFSVSRTAGTMPVYKPSVTPASYAADGSAQPVTNMGEQGLGFKDVLDVINPLQHVPIISTFYRKMTDDQISGTARIIGGTVFGGPIGGVLALADVAVKAQTGTTMGEKAFNMVDSLEGQRKYQVAMVPAQKYNSDYKSRMAGSMPVYLV
jgi:hypothetical protein